MPEEPFDKLLNDFIGRDVDIMIVHHVEGTARTTNGVLKEVTPAYIKMELEYKTSRFSLRHKKGTYVCNRKASSILSVFVAHDEKRGSK